MWLRYCVVCLFFPNCCWGWKQCSSTAFESNTYFLTSNSFCTIGVWAFICLTIFRQSSLISLYVLFYYVYFNQLFDLNEKRKTRTPCQFWHMSVSVDAEVVFDNQQHPGVTFTGLWRDRGRSKQGTRPLCPPLSKWASLKRVCPWRKRIFSQQEASLLKR